MIVGFWLIEQNIQVHTDIKKWINKWNRGQGGEWQIFITKEFKEINVERMGKTENHY